jgi:MFS family permease
MGGTTRVIGAVDAPERIFAVPDFVRLWTVGLVIFVVRWLETLAVSLFVWQHTHSAFLVTMVGMLRILPMGLFGAFLGVLAERIELRNGLIAIVLTSLITSATLALLANLGLLQVWHLALASFINGIGWAADNPVRRLMIGQVVGPARMSQAMSADVGSNNASRMLGPTVSGLIFAAVGIEGTFLVSMAFYCVSLTAAITLNARSGISPATGEGVATRIRQGIQQIRGTPRLIGTLCVTILFNVFGFPVTSLIPVVGADRFGLGPEATGLLASMDGVGAFAGALTMAVVSKPQRYARLYVGGVVTYLTMATLFAVAPHPLVAGAALLCMGFGHSGFAIMQATLVFLLTPPEMRSRVLGLLTVCIGLGPLGFTALGLLADVIGAPAATMVSGLAGLTALLLTWPLWRAILAPMEETKP